MSKLFLYFLFLVIIVSAGTDLFAGTTQSNNKKNTPQTQTQKTETRLEQTKPPVESHRNSKNYTDAKSLQKITRKNDDKKKNNGVIIDGKRYEHIVRDRRKETNPYALGTVKTESHKIEKIVHNVNISETVNNADNNKKNRRPEDGKPYTNKKRKLPTNETYTKWTHETPGIKYRGGQRVIVGDKTKRVYYTPNHYEDFWIIR